MTTYRYDPFDVTADIPIDVQSSLVDPDALEGFDPPPAPKEAARPAKGCAAFSMCVSARAATNMSIFSPPRGPTRRC